MKVTPFFWLSLFFLLFAPLQVSATTVVEMGVEELTAAATVIITGEVVSQESRWTENHRQIVTLVTIEVDEALLGAQSGDKVELVTLGGAVEDLGQYVPGEASFRVGEEVLVFLEPRGDGGALGVVGMSQGKRSLEVWPESGLKVALPQLNGLHLVRPKLPGEAPKGDEGVLTEVDSETGPEVLEDLLTQISFILQEG